MLFDTPTPLGFHVRCTRAHWEFIVDSKHLVLAGRAQDIEDMLRNPDQVRRSRKDPAVFLFYRGGRPRWFCAVARRQNDSGFLITAYPTDAIKIGEQLWTKLK
jgi:hypothetical protein